jgi:putative transposase
MKKSRYTEQHITFALKQTEYTAYVEETVRNMGISEVTFYNWKKKYSRLGLTANPSV